MEHLGALAVEIAMGIGLAACAGLRAFLPLFVTGLAGRLGWITIARPFDWLTSWPAIVVFGVAVATEILSDKIPVVDHLLDLVQGIVKPAAGTLVAAAALTDLTPLQATVLGIVVGGSTAGVVHLAKAKLRLVSSAFTGGFANPFLSLVEDMTAALGTMLSFVVPFVVLGCLVGMIGLLALGLRRLSLGATAAGGPV